MANPEMPQPPTPYEYRKLIEWVGSTNFQGTPAKWIPNPEEFNVMAVKGSLMNKFTKAVGGVGQWHEDVLAVAKHINRYLFTTEWMMSGDDTRMASLGMHLYIMQRLHDHAHPGATFLDAGCGTGYLLLAWMLMSGKDSRAIGIEATSEIASAAQAHLKDPNAVDSEAPPTDRSKIEVHVGDALHPEVVLRDALLAYVDRTARVDQQVDAINVGFAVDDEADLKVFAESLRENGILLAPICKQEQPGILANGRCAALFNVFRKEGSQLVQQQPMPGIEVQFIKASRGASAGFATNDPSGVATSDALHAGPLQVQVNVHINVNVSGTGA